MPSSCVCLRSTGILFTLHCCLPTLPKCAIVHWTGKLASNSLDLNPLDYSVWRALQNTTAKFQTLTETRANRLVDSAMPEHIELSDQSAAEKTDDGYQGRVLVLNFIWTSSACRWSLLLLLLCLWVKNWEKFMLLGKFSIISRVVKF